MKKRGLSFILLLFIIGMPIGYSSNVLFSKVDIPRVDNFISPKENSEGVTRYVYGFDLVASVKSGEINYYHSDRIGSNRLVSDSSGDIEKEFKSLPFGQEIKNEGVRYAFATGKELDESELHYFGARYYDSNSGRFTSVDPFSGQDGNLAYAYVANNPLMFVDPDGRKIVVTDFHGDYTKDEVLLAAVMFAETDSSSASDLEIKSVGITALNRMNNGMMAGTGSDMERTIQKGYGSLGKENFNLITGNYKDEDYVGWTVRGPGGEKIKQTMKSYKSYVEGKYGKDFETKYLSLARRLLAKNLKGESLYPQGLKGFTNQGGLIDVFGTNLEGKGADSFWEGIRKDQRYIIVGKSVFAWKTKGDMPEWTKSYWNKAENGIPPTLESEEDIKNYQ